MADCEPTFLEDATDDLRGVPSGACTQKIWSERRRLRAEGDTDGNVDGPVSGKADLLWRQVCCRPATLLDEECWRILYQPDPDRGEDCFQIVRLLDPDEWTQLATRALDQAGFDVSPLE